ncbi:MAG TPA: hypothetical protein VGJ58_04040 [Gaiellaceae bacterium]
MKLFRLGAVLAALALLVTVDAGASGSEMTDENELMMMVMGGGIEDSADTAEHGLSISAVATSALSATRPAAAQSIDVPGALATRAFGINAVDEIVGSYTDATGTYGFLLSQGEFTRIAFPGAVQTEAWGINPQGDIVGRYRLASDPRTFGFLLSDGAFTDISVAGYLHTLPIKISPSGEIVGCIHDVNFLRDMRGYVQRGDDVSLFEPLPSTMHNGVARGGGLIAGISFDSPTLVHGYVLEGSVYTQLDYPGATFTQAWDVSSTGKVVGYFNPVTSHGFSLDHGVFTQIDVPGAGWTRIFGINPQGEIVGSYADASNVVHGFLMRT